MGRLNINKSNKRRINLLVGTKGGIGQRVQKRHAIKALVYNDEERNTDYIEHFHLDKIMNLLRERNWDHINERMLGVAILLILKLNSIGRKKIVKSIFIMTAELYLSRFLVGQLNKIIDDNRRKYHREPVFEYFPDLKDHLFEYTAEIIWKLITTI